MHYSKALLLLILLKSNSSSCDTPFKRYSDFIAPLKNSMLIYYSYGMYAPQPSSSRWLLLQLWHVCISAVFIQMASAPLPWLIPWVWIGWMAQPIQNHGLGQGRGSTSPAVQCLNLSNAGCLRWLWTVDQLEEADIEEVLIFWHPIPLASWYSLLFHWPLVILPWGDVFSQEQKLFYLLNQGFGGFINCVCDIRPWLLSHVLCSEEPMAYGG